MTGDSAGRSGIVFQGREWIVLLRGVFAIALAVAAFTWPSRLPKLNHPGEL